MSKFKHNNTVNEDASLFLIIKRCFLFTIIFFMLSFSLLLILSLVFMRTKDPNAWVNIIGKFTLYFSAFLCSFLLSRKNKQSYVLSGLILGAIVTFIIFVISLFYPNSTNNSVLWTALIPFATLLGSVLAIKRHSSPRKRRKHRK